jgi:hypothetical protein
MAFSPQANYTLRVTAAAGEVTANFCGAESVWSAQRIPVAVKLDILDGSRYFSFQVALQLSPRSCVNLVLDPLFLRTSGSARNRAWGLWICSQELYPLDHAGGWDHL